MRLIILSVLLYFAVVNANNAQAKVSLHSDCKEYEEMVSSSFVLFSKTELIELGACTGVALLKDHRLSTLGDSCKEALEANSALGIATLTKVEAIKVGQCAGVINYIYGRYHDERVGYSSYSRRGYVYSCIKGYEAVNLLSEKSQRRYSRNDVRDLLCDRYNG